MGQKLMRARGFTLLEMMVVVAVVGVLTALALDNLRGPLTRAGDVEVVQRLLRSMQDARNVARLENICVTVVEHTVAPATYFGFVRHTCGTAALASDILTSTGSNADSVVYPQGRFTFTPAPASVLTFNRFGGTTATGPVTLTVGGQISSYVIAIYPATGQIIAQ